MYLPYEGEDECDECEEAQEDPDGGEGERTKEWGRDEGVCRVKGCLYTDEGVESSGGGEGHYCECV